MQSIVTANKPLVIMLMGPTACGKTALAMALSEILPIDIISVDSALVYRGMDIGTGKPTAAELAKAPHALVDIRDPADSYSVADFCLDARQTIIDSIANDRIPLLVGGTMMYFKALLEGLADMPAANATVREAIFAEAERQGWPALHRQLHDIDPAYANTIHPNHSQRISRGLEVYYISGKTMSNYRHQQYVNSTTPLLQDDYKIIQIALLPSDRSALHQCIEKRFKAMLASGLVDEVQSLFRRPDITAELPSMRTVGYRQVWQYLNAESDYDTMLLKGVAATRQLAKRQLTWLRRWPNLHNVVVELFAGNDDKVSQEIADAIHRIQLFLPIREF